MAGNSGGNFWFFVQPVRAWFLPDVRIHSHSITVFQTQAYLLVGLLAYAAIAIYGKYINYKRANAWCG